MPRRLVVSPHAARRIGVAEDWLVRRPSAAGVRVVGVQLDASAERVRHAALRRGGAMGWQRSSLSQLAATLAAPLLAARGLVAVGPLALAAVIARVLQQLAAEGALGRFAETGGGPGLSRAIAAVLEECRGALVPEGALEEQAPELARVLAAYRRTLHDAGLADRAEVEACAFEALEASSEDASDMEGLLLLDLPAPNASRRRLLAALIARAPECLATLPAGDASAREDFEALLGSPAEALSSDADEDSSLHQLQRHLFEDSNPSPRDPDPSVELLSAPGEGRECVEIARRIQLAAREGVAFDDIAVLMRSPDNHAPFLADALRRAGVPAHFARGLPQPDPAGRALLALVACAAEGCSVQAFCEYLSLGVVPRIPAAEAPADPADGDGRWIAPDAELLPEHGLRAETGIGHLVEAGEAEVASGVEGDADAEAAGAPRHWERLLCDASVIAGHARWERRLAALGRELERSLASQTDADAPIARVLRRDLAQLGSLRDFALPLVEELASWPGEALWGEWLDRLSALAARGLRNPARVLAVLSELAPMSEVGPVGLREVQAVLTPRLQHCTAPPEGARFGKVFVAPADAARGLCFERVFVPGLAEKLFPRKIEEEPILLDALRRRLDAGLETNAERLEHERNALRVAVGAARGRVLLSYPRVDTQGSRARVPSFYALEALRAAEGRLPGFDELAQRAETVGDARLGWPAPPRSEDAIDVAEYDLSRLRHLESVDPEQRIGSARYLLGANPHLARALRFRARRWIAGWTSADGLLKPDAAAAQAIAEHTLDARSYSATALQHYAACPYKFYLSAVCGLSKREEPRAIEDLDPLERGSLVHDVHFELSGALRDAGLLPVTPERLDEARKILDPILDSLAERAADRLAPTIERVWRDGIQALRADLREWLRRASEDTSGFVPWRFELAFGLPGRQGVDPASRDASVALEVGLRLRGSIDVVERSASGRLRVSDHKTGQERFGKAKVVDGGHALQPVLYALAAEKLFPDAEVESGRLYYCTSAGGFVEREVALDTRARESAARVAKTIGDALAEPFLPAAPAEDACRWCDFRPVCGPYEEQRVAVKWQPPLAPLHALRKLP